MLHYLLGVLYTLYFYMVVSVAPWPLSCKKLNILKMEKIQSKSLYDHMSDISNKQSTPKISDFKNFFILQKVKQTIPIWLRFCRLLLLIQHSSR